MMQQWSRVGYGRQKFRVRSAVAAGVLVGAPLAMVVVASGSASATPDGLVPANIPPIGVGIQPTGIAVDAATNTAYVVGSQGATTDQVVAINATTGTVVGVVDLDANSTPTAVTGAAPTAAAVDTATQSVFVADGGSGQVTRFSEASCDVADPAGCADPGLTDITIPDPPGAMGASTGQSDPTSVGVDEATGVAYVADGDDGTLWAITATASTATQVLGASFTSESSLALTVDSASHTVYVGDPATSTIDAVNEVSGSTNTISLPDDASPSGLAVDDATHTLYVSDETSGSVYDVDTTTGAVGTITTPAPGDSLTAVTVDPLSDTVYATDQTSNQVVVIDGSTNTYVSSVATGDAPSSIALDTAASPTLVLTGNVGDNDVTALVQQFTPPPVTPPPVTPPPVTPPPTTTPPPAAAPATYRVAAADGAVDTFTSSGGTVSAPIPGLNEPIVGVADTPDGGGYWLVASDGGVFSFGDASFYGSTGNLALNKPIVGMASTPDGGGYWLVASDGGVFSFGDASFYGSTGSLVLNKPVVGMAANPAGGGYWLVASDGGVFSFGTSRFYGSEGGVTLNQPMVGITASESGNGYRTVAADGGMFVYGDATWEGSLGNIHLNRPIVSTATTPDGDGYWLFASDGGVFSFAAPFLGSASGVDLGAAVVGGTSSGAGSGS